MTTLEIRPANDRLLILLAVAGIALSIVSAIVGALGILPAPLVILIVLGATSVALRVAILLRTRRSSALSNPRVMNIVSLCGLGFSAVTALATLGVTLQYGSPLLFIADVLLHAWSLTLLLAAATPVRTVGWRAMVGVGLSGFLAASAMSRMVGAPVIHALGMDNFFAMSVWVPVTEEVFKALPIAVIALIAARTRLSRPSAVDMALLGTVSGSAFTLIENAEFGRIFDRWDVAPPLSLIFPTMDQGTAPALLNVVAGHSVWTGLFAMGIGFGVLYFRRFRFAWIAIPATFLLVVIEHGMVNALVDPIFGGILSTILLIAGFASLVVFEGRPLRPLSGFRDGIFLAASTVAVRRRALAGIQAPRSTAAVAIITESAVSR